MQTPDTSPHARPPRLTMQAFFHDATDELLSADRGLPFTVLALFRTPAKVVRDYIEWRSPRVTKPLRYFLIVVLLVNAIAALAHRDVPQRTEATTASAAAAGTHDVETQSMRTGRRFGSPMRWVWDNHVEWVLLFTVPMLALAMRREFREHGYNFAEHWVVALYAVAQAYWLVGVWTLLGALEFRAAAWAALALAPLALARIYVDVFGGSKSRAFGRAIYGLAVAIVMLFAATMIFGITAATIAKSV